jgi:hypothetical protein
MSGAASPFIVCLRGMPSNTFTFTFTSTSDDALLCFGEYPVSESVYRILLCLISYKTSLTTQFQVSTVHHYYKSRLLAD